MTEKPPISHLNRYDRALCKNEGGVQVSTIPELKRAERPCQACLALIKNVKTRVASWRRPW